jgi:uncharacterized membrane protein YGL010W
MNATLPNPALESRSKTYFKAAAFLAPPILIWSASCVFVFPKLKQIWRDAGFSDSTMMGFMHTSEFFMRHGVLFGAAFVALLCLVEWRSGGSWPRYRRASVGTVVFVLNTAVLILIWAMFISALSAAPALARMK